MTDETDVDQNLQKLFDNLQRLGDTDMLMLRSYWDVADESSRQQAWHHANEAIAAAHRQALLADARNRLATWVNNYESGYGLLGGLIGGTEGMPLGTIRQAAVPPILDAVIATIADDGISDDELLTLCEPMINLGFVLWIGEARQ